MRASSYAISILYTVRISEPYTGGQERRSGRPARPGARLLGVGQGFADRGDFVASMHIDVGRLDERGLRMIEWRPQKGRSTAAHVVHRGSRLRGHRSEAWSLQNTSDRIPPAMATSA